MARPVPSFWRRVSDGVAIDQLWSQFHADARASYQLYAAEVDWTPREGERRGHRFFRLARAMFWAIIMKLSPARRVLFIVSLALLVLPGFRVQSGDTRFEMDNLSVFGGAGMFVLLTLELADRVTMKRDLEIAKEIQTWLMPAAPPAVPGVEIAFTTRPANTVAGDYYDAFFRSPDGQKRLLLVVADVAGKSVPAALLMATLQASLRTLAALPGSVLDLTARLNQYACAQNLGGRRFTTAFLAELDPETGRLNYVNAGHNWPVLRRISGAMERLETGGLPLGIMASAPYQCGTTTLGPGDLLLIFTDGLVEAEDDRQQEYGEDRMFSVLADWNAVTADDVMKRMMTSVDSFVGYTRQHDDITCMVVRSAG
jgi:phosphoserine phosphatase RsbU/P